LTQNFTKFQRKYREKERFFSLASKINIYASPKAKKSGLRPAMVRFGEYVILVPGAQVGVEPALSRSKYLKILYALFLITSLYVIVNIEFFMIQFFKYYN